MHRAKFKNPFPTELNLATRIDVFMRCLIDEPVTKPVPSPADNVKLSIASDSAPTPESTSKEDIPQTGIFTRRMRSRLCVPDVKHTCEQPCCTNVSVPKTEFKKRKIPDKYEDLESADRSLYDRLLAQALRAIDTAYCQARVKNGLCQCRRKVFQNQEFCQLHFRQRLRLKHGVQGNPLPQGELHKRLLQEIRRRANTRLEWYSRDYMWTLATQLEHVNCLDDLSDDQYMDALKETNIYYRSNAGLRRRMHLEKHQGPQSLDDRGTEKENYLGNVNRFKYFHHDAFIRELTLLGTTTGQATERQVMNALHNVSLKLMNAEFLRSKGEDIHFQGPQSYIHLRNEERLDFRVATNHYNNSSRRKIWDSDVTHTRFLTCESCGKLRRVDKHTIENFSKERWSVERIDSAIEQIKRDIPFVDAMITASFSSTTSKGRGRPGVKKPRIPDTVICLSFFERFITLLGDAWGASNAIEKAAFLKLFCHQATTQGRTTNTKDFDRKIEELHDALPGPAFSCDMLVDTSCNEPCDWVLASETNHDLSSLENIGHETLLGYSCIVPPGETDLECSPRQPYYRQFTSHGNNSQSAECENSNVCNVRGCDCVCLLDILAASRLNGTKERQVEMAPGPNTHISNYVISIKTCYLIGVGDFKS